MKRIRNTAKKSCTLYRMGQVKTSWAYSMYNGPFTDTLTTKRTQTQRTDWLIDTALMFNIPTQKSTKVKLETDKCERFSRLGNYTTSLLAFIGRGQQLILRGPRVMSACDIIICVSSTGCLRNYRKSILLLCISTLGRLRDLQFIFALIYRTPSICFSKIKTDLHRQTHKAILLQKLLQKNIHIQYVQEVLSIFIQQRVDLVNNTQFTYIYCIQ